MMTAATAVVAAMMMLVTAADSNDANIGDRLQKRGRQQLLANWSFYGKQMVGMYSKGRHCLWQGLWV